MNAPLSIGYCPEHDVTIGRFREAGDLTLDLHNRDARVDDRWLGLHPREFALLWRLAARPGERLTGQQLRVEAWGVPFVSETDVVPVHLARLRARLAAAGLAQMIGTDPEGRHFLHAPLREGLSRIAAG